MEFRENQFFKKRTTDKVWWATTDLVGPVFFSFDKKKVYSLWSDYPNKLTKEEREIFDKENPYWVDFFSPS